jgi:hypothetical protein
MDADWGKEHAMASRAPVSAPFSVFQLSPCGLPAIVSLCGTTACQAARSRFLVSAFRIPHSAFRIPHLTNFPLAQKLGDSPTSA